MSVRQKVIDSLFGGREDVLREILVQSGDATSPDGVVSAPIGAFLVIDYVGNAADDDVYINTDGSTAWSLVYDASSAGHI